MLYSRIYPKLHYYHHMLPFPFVPVMFLCHESTHLIVVLLQAKPFC